MNHWIIAPIVMPAALAVVAIVCAQLQRPGMVTGLWIQRSIGLLGSVGFCVIGLVLLAASEGGPQVYRLGNWPAPFGIMLVLDRLSALMVLLLGGLSVPILLYSIDTGLDDKGRHFHPLWLFLMMGISGAFLTGDAFNLFVFFEVLLIASYGLMIHGAGRARLVSGVQYIAFNLVGSALFLLALGVVYAVTGTLNMADLAGRVASLPANDHALIRAAAVMMIMVFAIKGALVPFQFWLPGTYANAPGPIAAMFAIMTKVGAYATIRMMTLVFVTGSAAMGGLLGDLLFVAGLATIVLGAVGVLAAKDLARMVAFAAIGSMGSVFLAISAMTPQATVAALYMMVHSTLATAMLFLVTDLILARRGHVQLTQDRPIPHQGLIGALFILACVAMVGMPPFSGFIAKLLVMQVWRDEAAMVWSVLLVSTLITMIGMARAGSVLFWKSHSGERVLTAQHPHIKNVVAFVSVAVFAAMLAGWTVGAGPITIWLMDAAQALHAPAAYIAAHQLPGVN